MAKLFGDDWPVSSRPAKLVICVIVFALGIAAGAAIAMWVTVLTRRIPAGEPLRSAAGEVGIVGRHGISPRKARVGHRSRPGHPEAALRGGARVYDASKTAYGGPWCVSRLDPQLAAVLQAELHGGLDDEVVDGLERRRCRVVIRCISYMRRCAARERLRKPAMRRSPSALASRPRSRTTSHSQDKGSRQTATYRALISIAEEVVAGARKALDDTAAMRTKAPLIALKIEALRDEITHYCGLGEQVPNAEKIYSIFEPHTDLIKRGKVRTPVEFGHKVFLAESAKGLVTPSGSGARNTAVRRLSDRRNRTG
jgi:hypothetical protein